MAKIAQVMQRALALRDRDGEPGRTTVCKLAGGAGWRVADVICTAGPGDRPFEERHGEFTIAMVVAGSFRYRGENNGAGELMTPGSLLLGHSGHCFECGHEHGAGDRCVSFHYTPTLFERIATEFGVTAELRSLRLPPLRALAPLVARACGYVDGADHGAWEELALQLAAQTITLNAEGKARPTAVSARAVAQVTELVRSIENHPAGEFTLDELARQAALSPYHFLRVFQRIAGVTPHQYLLRTRLRAAALRLATEPDQILAIALDCGFGDISNFNRAFRAEFGTNPRDYRRQGVARRQNATL